MFSIRILATAAILLTAGLAHAESTRFECSEIGGVKGNSSIIDLTAKTANIAGRNVNGALDLVSVENVDEEDASLRYVFLGPNDSVEYGHIKLELSLPSKEAKLLTLDENDMQEEIGSAVCTPLN